MSQVMRLEDYFCGLERQLMARMNAAGLESVTIVSIQFRGGESALIANSDGSWDVKRADTSYPINNPLLDKLLEKFALLTEKEFQEKVGDSSLGNWECERMRLNELQRMLENHRDVLLLKFIARVTLVLESLY